MTPSSIDQVEEFHDTFGIEVQIFPAFPDPQIMLLRLQLLQEELGELCHAMAKGDMLEALDALTDLQYVLDGAYLALGLKDIKDLAFAEVHRSNMSKTDEHGRALKDASGRIMKSDRYSPPNLAPILQGLELPR